MNSYHEKLHNEYFEKRYQERERLRRNKPEWYKELEYKFNNAIDYESKKKHEINLNQEIEKYLDQIVK